MRHLFIINPAAGKYDRTEELKAEISKVMNAAGLSYEIAVTTGPMSAAELVRSAATDGDEPLRVYACGGDGTLNEVVCGAVGFGHVSVTHYPTGSGNDFIKIFGENSKRFFDLKQLLDCEYAELDLIKVNNRYCLNICSMGLDARIGTEMARYKRLPLVSGKGAYYISLIVNIIKGIHQPVHIEIDGQVFDDRFTLVCICNGRYYGGSFNPVPDAMPDDGLMDVLLVQKCSRLKVASVINVYASGCYRNLPDLITHYYCREVTVSYKHPGPINVDGELVTAETAVFRISGYKVNFFFPKGAYWR